jgi:predicted nucleic acid-binding protein
VQVLADTNVLLRLVEPDHPHSAAAADATKSIRLAGHQLVIVPQVIYEFWVVATRPTNNNGLGLEPADARNLLAKLSPTLKLLRDERSIYEVWQRIVVDHRITGKQAHDARLVAAMIRHDISHVLTFNVSDFSRFGSIKIVDPLNSQSFPTADR